MGGSTTTTVQQAPPSAEERAYLDSQQALAAKQLEILNSTQSYDQNYMDQIKPILDQQTQLLSQSISQQGDYLKSLQPATDAQAAALKASVDQQAKYLEGLQPSLDAQAKLLQQQIDQATAAANDPVQKQIQDNQAKLIAQQLADQQDLAPLQKQLLQKQLADALQGNNATPEQAALIDKATNDALASGTSDIQAFAGDAVDQLRRNLAPTLGLRPSDTPIIDRGQLVAKEAVRQYGKLASDLGQANANAKLNYPLAAAQLSNATSATQGQLSLATQSFQDQLAQTAAANRLNLISAGNQSFGIGLSGGGIGGTGSALALGLTGGGLPGGASAIGTGFDAGIGLAGASRENPLSFSRGSTSTVSNNPGFLDYLNGVGNLFQGLGSAGLKLGSSDARVKYNIQTAGYDDHGRRWVHFTYKGEPATVRHTGVIAQEVEKTDPHAVFTDGHGMKFVAYNRLGKAA